MALALVVLAVFSTLHSCSPGLVKGDVDELPVVQISNGPVMGRVFTSTWTSKKVYAFTGIPYAAPPVGNLRFKDPTVPENWTEVLNCTTDAAWCVQHTYPAEYPLTLSEDCLFLNVYSPQINVTSGALWPVMVWVHGGGWLGGCGNYAQFGPDMLLEEGIIVVTLNYRLGAFGFLTLGISEAPGNSGQKDQVLALRWVQKEIEKFGGDPDRVTLAGESAGSFSVHLHYLSPLSKGLFHQVIGESGTALTNAARVDHAPYGMKLAELLNCPTADAASALECLLAASADDILKCQAQISGGFEESINGDGIIWRASVDQTLSSQPFLPAMPRELYQQGQGSFVPFLMGTLKDESSLIIGSSEAFIKNITNNLVYLIPEKVRNTSSHEEIQHKTQDIEKLYFNGTTPSYSNMMGFLNMYTDVLMAYPTSMSARLFRSRAPVYLYEFTYNGKFKADYCSQYKDTFNVSLVCHAEELDYLFIIKKINQTADDTEEMTTWRRMARMWTNFVKYGTPTTSVSDSLLQDVSWHPIDNTTSRYLNIDKSLTMVEDDYMGARAAMWDSVYEVSSSASLLHWTLPLTVVLYLVVLCVL